MSGPLGGGSVALRLETSDGVALRGGLRRDGTGRGLAVIFAGRTEYLEKYEGVADALTTRGFDIAAVDWRGQGRSARALGNPLKGHIGDFAEYQRDLDALLAAPEVACITGPRLAVCHSMGGGIGLRALVDGRGGFDAAVFTAPMWGLDLGRLSPFARIAAGLAVRLGLGEHYAPGDGDKIYVSGPFEENLLTSSPEMWTWMGERLAANPLCALGAPTWSWVAAASEECAALAEAAPPSTPKLVCLGDEENIVNVGAVRDGVARDPAAKLWTAAGARHELFMESAELRALTWAEIDRFLDDVGFAPPQAL